MTEAEWRECSILQEVLTFLRDKASDRKFRLFACACCRRIWRLLSDERCKRAVLEAEQFADGLIDKSALRRAELSVNELWNETISTECTDAEVAAIETISGVVAFPDAGYSAASATSYDALGANEGATLAEEKRAQCDLLRDIMGNPFRPVRVDTTWLSADVVSLAQSIYDERAFDRLRILADAMEDAGCTAADMLDHCRQPGEHTRGCWVVDLVLGKS